MGNTQTALVFVVFLNLLMWLSQVAMIDINPTSTQFYNCNGTIFKEFDKNKCSGTPILDDSGYASSLPYADEDISPETGNIFTDMFSSIKSWFAEATGLSYVGSILKAPVNFLNMMHLPSEISFGLGTLWYILSLFVVISYFWGRE